jgi:hypothetical protein
VGLVILLCSACDFSLEDLFQIKVSRGPLTNEEIQTFASEMESLGDKVTDCLVKEAIVNASRIGDPEKLDPSTVELLPVDHWDELDKSGKRLILTQVVISQAIPLCTHGLP